MRVIVILLACASIMLGCKNEKEKLPRLDNKEVSNVITRMTDIMIHDVSNPPLASRFFSYACLAGYEVMAQNNDSLPSMKGKLNNYPEINKPKVDGAFSADVAAIVAMMEVSAKMQPSGKLMADYKQKWLDSCSTLGFSAEVLENSVAYAQDISKQILAYAKADQYNKISNYQRYTPGGKDSTWIPTPPAYFPPVEPYFHTVRSFTLDSANQFNPAPPVSFSTDKNSEFFKLMRNLYDEKLTPEHREMAAFWDCNPFALQDNGHLMVGMKKISPGAHWMGITGIVCQQKKLSLAKTLQIHTAVAIGLMDGFIGCWGEKYRSNRVRPETAIRRHIDPKWKPMLQTPPFPEYLSGHSTISSASAVILTSYFGDNFSYTDTVEVRFGLPPRAFKSFNDAASEAAISRFYGGIHFMDAIERGQQQGTAIGKQVLKRLERN
ncbi:vanadium-dependent haloperoxidase [Emticicia sp. TH156]|uniref:vanadium-dependent haloperoxidase n=1 Tax=Emticicia sp. TH156 TaxID=2067454 RepID=UPI001E6318B6|nr:vanadium-dependent haloperoxidase [Emticicia sp. TH156]